MNIEEFNEAFAEHYKGLCFFASQIIKDKDAAEDIVQETYIKLYQRLNVSKYKACKAFLYLTTRNACYNYCRDESNRDRIKSNLGPIINNTETYNYEKELILAEFMSLVVKELESIPGEARKKAFKMAYFDNMNNTDISQKLGILKSSVKEHKWKTLTFLKKYFSIFKIKWHER